jgi:hypothetical protein
LLADGSRVRTPAWASLEQVLGTYDPPFVSESAGSIVFGDDDRSLVVLRRNGQVRVWDRARQGQANRSRVPSRSLKSLRHNRVIAIRLTATGRKNLPRCASANFDTASGSDDIRVAPGRLAVLVDHFQEKSSG